MRAQRPLREITPRLLAVLALALALQLGLHALAPEPGIKAPDLLPAPSTKLLRIASMDEPIALAKLLMLQLQAFDYQSGSRIPYQDLDYVRVEAWLKRMLELDPRGQYPLFAAARLYAEVPQPAKQRGMMEFIYREYFADPNRRWPWLAHAAFLAKHRLRDMDLALKYASALQRYTTADDVPAWVRTLEAFMREDLNELETARLMIGGLIASGKVKDRSELAFLNGRLEEIEARLAAESPGLGLSGRRRVR